MFLHSLAHRKELAFSSRILVQRWNICGRRRRGCAEQIIEDPFSAHYRRRSIRVRGDHQDGSLTKKSKPGFVGKSDTPEVAAINIWNVVVPSEPFVHKRVVRRHE